MKSGFASESNISDELCEFMGLDLGTKKARTDVVKFIIQYMKI